MPGNPFENFEHVGRIDNRFLLDDLDDPDLSGRTHPGSVRTGVVCVCRWLTFAGWEAAVEYA